MNNLADLVRILGIEKSKAQIIASGGNGIDFHFEISPREFLEQAASDLAAGGSSALFNSITNSRRAILCQMDRVLQAFGFQIKSLSTKRKTEILTFLGLPTPNILKKVGQTRNLLEHEFKIPPQDKVEDSYDIALLFIESFDRYIDTFWGEFCMGNHDEIIKEDSFTHYRNLSFDFNERSKSYHVRAERYSGSNIFTDRTIVDEIYISDPDPLFAHCVRMSLAQISSTPINDVISDLFRSLVIKPASGSIEL